MENGQRYSYRTEDNSIKANDVVLVPTQKGQNYAIVMRVFKCTDKTAPYPPEQTKVITKKVGRKTRVNLSGVDMRVPLDISVVVKKTLTGQKTIVVGQAERNAARRKYAGANVLLVEYYPVSMTGKVVMIDRNVIIEPPNKPEDQRGKPAQWIAHPGFFSTEYECSYCHYCYNSYFPVCPNCHKKMLDTIGKPAVKPKAKPPVSACWYKQEHMWGSNTCKCSNCGSTYKSASPSCPNCKAEMKKTQSDPVWVDEMAEYDAMFEE